jgi:hypothetical protein
MSIQICISNELSFTNIFPGCWLSFHNTSPTHTPPQWSLNSKSHACKAGTLPVSSFFYLFILFIFIYLFIYLFFAVLWFELRAYTLSHSTSPFL